MNNKIGVRMSFIGISGILFGRLLNRVLTNYIGDNGSNIIFAISGAIVFCTILILIAMRYYIAAILSIIFSIPLIVGGIGLYLDNMDIVGLGILLIFIIFPTIAKVMKK